MSTEQVKFAKYCLFFKLQRDVLLLYWRVWHLCLVHPWRGATQLILLGTHRHSRASTKLTVPPDRSDDTLPPWWRRRGGGCEPLESALRWVAARLATRPATGVLTTHLATVVCRCSGSHVAALSFITLWPLCFIPVFLWSRWRYRNHTVPITTNNSDPLTRLIVMSFLPYPLVATSIYLSFNPRPAGPLDFPPPAGGGGGFERPPPWSRLLVAVEKNERQRSKARKNHFEIISVIFWLRSKLRSPGVKIPKFSKTFFSTIKSLILKVEQRIWYHRVCLVKARRTIYNMTERSRSKFDLSQVRPRSHDDRNGSYCISVDSPGQDERTDTNPTSLSVFDQKLLANDGCDLGWPQMAFGGVGNAIFFSKCPQLSYTIWFQSNKFAPM